MQPPATPATPDYAAGLTALNPPTPSLVVANNKSPVHTPSTPLQPPSTPYSQPVTPYFQSSPQTPRTPQTPLYTPVIIESNSNGNYFTYFMTFTVRVGFRILPPVNWSHLPAHDQQTKTKFELFS